MYERLAYEAAQRALDKQERLLEELRLPLGRRRKRLHPAAEAEQFVFALVGAGLYEGLYAVREDLAEVYRRLAYDLDRFWDENDAELQKLFTSFRLAAGAPSAEILVLIAMVSDNLSDND